MTDSTPPPPKDPANNPPEERHAESKAWPTERSLGESKNEPEASERPEDVVIELGGAPQSTPETAPAIAPEQGETRPTPSAADAPPPPPPFVAGQELSAQPTPPIPPPLAPAPMASAAAPLQTPAPMEPAGSTLPPLPPPYSPPRPEPASGPADPSLPGAPPPTPPMPPEPPISGAPPGAAQPFPEPAPSRSSAWAMAAHLTSLFDFGFSILMVGLIGPLVVWLLKKDEDPEADWHGRESLNFQLNLLLVWVAAVPLYCLCGLGAAIHVLLPLVKIIMVVIASIKAAEGERFRYPFTLRLIDN